MTKIKKISRPVFFDRSSDCARAMNLKEEKKEIFLKKRAFNNKMFHLQHQQEITR